ncbi:MAG: ATP-binding protein [Nitrospiraceae bacterium]
MSTPKTGPRRTSPWGLRGKLILSMLLVGAVPLAGGLILAFLQGSKEIREVSGESFKALAIETARKLDLLVAEEIARTSRIAADTTIVTTLEVRRDSLHSLPPDELAAQIQREQSAWDSRDPARMKAVSDHPLSRLLREYSSGSRSEPDHAVPSVVRAATRMLYLTDLDGNLVGALSLYPPYINRDQAWWQGAFHKGVGRLFIEDLTFNETLHTHVFTISVPVMDSLRYEAIGVLHRVLDAKEFFSASIQPIRFGKTGHVMLIDQHGTVMSCPILPTGVRLSDPALIPLVTPLMPGWVHANSDGHGGRSQSIIGFAPLPETSRATNGSLDGGGWHTFVWQDSEELFAPVTHLFSWMAIFGGLALLLLAGLGAVAATRIVTPIRQLQAAAQAIGRGEPAVTPNIRTGDELQDLAEDLSRMARQIERSFAGLTSQVERSKRDVQVLQQSTDHILDAVPTPIVLLDRDAQVHYMNRACREAFTVPAQTTLPGSLFDILAVPAPSRAQLNRELHIMGNGHASHAAALDALAAATAETRDPLSPSSTPDAATRRPELQIGAHVYRYDWFRLPSPAGESPRLGLVLRNATEETRLQAAWIDAEKSGSLGVLTAGIGHELNNPLFGILGLGDAIQHEENPAQVKEFAKTIVQQGRRMATIIRDFTGVSRDATREPRLLVDLAQHMDQALERIEHATPQWHIDIERQYAAASPIRVVPAELQQVLAQVLSNAVQAMGAKGHLRVTVEQVETTVSLRIRDSGPGIPTHHLGKIFDPFFTTKGQGEGSGLGLTIARRLVAKNGGQIAIASAPGEGTTCTISFPAAPHPQAEGGQP